MGHVMEFDVGIFMGHLMEFEVFMGHVMEVFMVFSCLEVFMVLCLDVCVAI